MDVASAALLSQISSSVKPKSNTALYVVGGAVALFVVYKLFASPGWQETDLEQEDYDLLEGNTPAGAVSLLQGDTSPVFFTSGSNLTVADYITLGDKITTKWAARMATISASMNANVPVMGAGLGYLLAQSEGSISTRAVDIWLRLLEQYCSIHRNAVASVASTIADVAVATLVGVEKSKTCIQWTFTKEVIESSQYNVTTDVNVSEGGSAAKVAWGLFGSSSSSKSVTTHVTEITTENRSIRYIPSCTAEALDPTQLDAVLAVQSISLTAALSLMINVTKQYPDPVLFFKKVTP